MNTNHFFARAAQALLAVSVTAASVLIFQFAMLAG